MAKMDPVGGYSPDSHEGSRASFNLVTGGPHRRGLIKTETTGVEWLAWRILLDVPY